MHWHVHVQLHIVWIGHAPNHGEIPESVIELHTSSAPTSRAQIVSARVEEHRLTNGEILGAPRRLGAGDRSLPPGFTFGKPSLPKVLLPSCCPTRSGSSVELARTSTS